MSTHRRREWRFRVLQITVLVAVLFGLRHGIGDGFTLRDQSVGLAATVADAWNGTFRAIRRQVDRLGPPG